jgi:hypothetical protein
MIKQLDIKQKIKFKNFVLAMAKVHYKETQFLDLLNSKDPKADRVLRRYSSIPKAHVEDFDVQIAIQEIDGDRIPEEMQLPAMRDGKFYFMHVEILDEDTPIDMFELMEFVQNGERDEFVSLYDMYQDSETEEMDDF